MSRVLFLPDERTLVLVDSHLSVERLINLIEDGGWTPPKPYDKIIALKENAKSKPQLRAMRQGRLVIVTPDRPLPSPPRAAQDRMLNLSLRQRQVLQGLAEGLTTKEIALRLGLQARTISMHIAAIKEQLGASSRAQTVGWAAVLGLCEPSGD